jgi:predicted nucleotidyltransferase
MSFELETCVRLLRENGAKEVYLFGSHFRGTQTSHSDIDLAVTGLPDQDYYGVLGDLLMATGKRIDLVLLDDGSSFSEHIKRKIANGWAELVG